MAAWARERQPELVIAPEARGLILGGALAQALGVGVAAARAGQAAPETVAEAYTLEYGRTRWRCTPTPSGPARR